MLQSYSRIIKYTGFAGRFIILVYAIILVSCDGDRRNNPPIADAGVDQNVPRGAVVSLDGSGSDPDGDLLSYAWSFRNLPPGSSATLTNDTDPKPSFVADLLGEYVIVLFVDDGEYRSVADEVKIVVNTILIYQNNFSQNSLDDFIVGETGNSRVSIVNGQLRIDSGEGFLNRGYVALNLAKISSEYFPNLIDNQAKIMWSFNASNSDGEICGACNNLFFFKLFSDPDPSAASAFGYSLIGGGFVGSRIFLVQEAYAASIHGAVNSTIIDINDGLETLPTIGAFKLTYEPHTSKWELYYEEGLSPADPMKINKLLGANINSGFVTEPLSYLILGGYNTSGAFFDNLTVKLDFEIP